MSNFRLQLEAFLQLMGSPLGAVAIAGVLLLMFALGMLPKLKWPVLVFLLFCSTLSYRIDLSNFVVTLAFPLEQIRSQCRGICAALLIVLLVPP